MLHLHIERLWGWASEGQLANEGAQDTCTVLYVPYNSDPAGGDADEAFHLLTVLGATRSALGLVFALCSSVEAMHCMGGLICAVIV